MVIILIRDIYEIVDLSLGDDSYLVTKEWTGYLFDTIAILIVTAICNVIHPGRYLNEVAAGDEGWKVTANPLDLEIQRRLRESESEGKFSWMWERKKSSPADSKEMDIGEMYASKENQWLS